ncbi:hypothetical protein CAEBREN_09979 [Caenorhabditis brenneri]|uniref:Uncharacterized protein n=1 Tax=Caenorhabditis brenneri TaxID=135651 RepID=G0P639_CAEBE|nr:hypothetical protein CAEBREN_09979 [Caenorhabditis brenneri]
MVHRSLLTILAVLALGFTVEASISAVNLQVGDSYLIRNAENGAEALVRSIYGDKQTMAISGPNKGKWISESGKTVDSSNFQLFQNGSVLLKSARRIDSGTYQKYPNPIIRIGDIGYAPPVLIIAVKDGYDY